MSHTHSPAAPCPPADGNIRHLATAASTLVPFSRFSRGCVSTARLRSVSIHRLRASIPQLER